jgi:hypothetical protein
VLEVEWVGGHWEEKDGPVFQKREGELAIAMKDGVQGEVCFCLFWY